MFRHRPFRRPLNTLFLDSFRSNALPDFIDPSDYGVLNTCIAGSPSSTSNPSTDAVRESARFAFLAVKGARSIWHLDHVHAPANSGGRCGRSARAINSDQMRRVRRADARQSRSVCGAGVASHRDPNEERGNLLIQPPGTLSLEALGTTGTMHWSTRETAGAIRVMRLELRHETSNEHVAACLVDKPNKVEVDEARDGEKQYDERT